MNCMFCDGQEVSIMPNGKKRVYKTVNPFVCGTCTQTFLGMSKAQKQEAYDRAVALKKTDLIKFLSSYVEEKNNAKVIGRDMVRERPSGEIRPSHQKIGQEPTINTLDKRRP